LARPISLIPHLFWLPTRLSFRKDYSPPLVRHLDPSPGTDLRRVTAPRASTEVSGAPDGAGASDASGHTAGGTARARSERRGWTHAMGRSEKRTTHGGARAERWLRRQMQSGADGRSYDIVKRGDRRASG
jgi:hypothetical protein